ncbi:prolyl oligopeptidase family serine peptidase [Candidatus Gracilibacteria bacterium]|nr:prolyl oligopeptidase family serine peptidase [Candidatus Gracilibacteria bacterium]
MAQTIYPTTPEVKHNDQVGNTKINDDYNWMENFENQKKLNQLLEKQNEFYEAYFANYEPELRTKIIEDLAKYDTRVKQPESYLDKLEDDHLFDGKVYKFSYNFDSKGITATKKYGSPTSPYVVYTLKFYNTDYSEVLIYNTKERLFLKIAGVRLSDVQVIDQGVFYSKIDNINSFEEHLKKFSTNKIMFHKFESSLSEDQIVIENEGNSYASLYKVEVDGKNVFAEIKKTSGNKIVSTLIRLYYETGKVKSQVIFDNKEELYWLSSRSGKVIYKSPELSDNFSIFMVNSSDYSFKQIIKGSSKTIDDAILIDDYIVVSYLDELDSFVMVYDIKGQLLDKIDLPGVGRFTLTPLDGKQFEFEWYSPKLPPTKYIYDFNSKKEVKYTHISTKKFGNYKPYDYRHKILKYQSKGKEYSMLLVYNSKTDMSKPNNIYITAYGGFGKPTELAFSIFRSYLTDQGVVLAYPIISGAMDSTYSQYLSSVGINRKLASDNFNDSIKYLIDNGYTEKGKVISIGYSNGGLLVANAAIDEPEYYKAVISKVGPQDLISYQNGTFGRLWTREYADPTVEENIPKILGYSPYHKIKKDVEYPKFYIETSKKDDRVAPWHSAKLAGKLQKYKNDSILLFTRDESGHGNISTFDKGIIDKLLFILKNFEGE